MISVVWRGWGVLAWLIPLCLFPFSLWLVHEWDPSLAERRSETIAAGIAYILGSGGIYFAIDYLKRLNKYAESDMFMFVRLKYTPYLLFGIGSFLFILEFTR